MSKYTKACPECGDTFETRIKNKRFCFDTCARASSRKRRGETNVMTKWAHCTNCGSRFWSRNGLVRCGACHYESKATYTDVDCAWCGETFKTNRGAEFCSDACRNGRWREKNGLPHRGPEHTFSDERRLSLFERDGYVCYLCGTRIERYAKANWEEDGPSIDHILPYSKGGNGKDENLQTSHYTCNVLKGDKDLTVEQAGRLESMRRLLSRN